jgi:hypothetical protein
MQEVLAINQHRILFPSLLTTNTKIKTYRTIILPVVLHEHEIWSLILREKHRLRVFQNTVLRRMLGPKRDEVKGEWRSLNYKELHNLYSSPNVLQVVKSTQMRQVGHKARVGGQERYLQGFGWET